MGEDEKFNAYFEVRGIDVKDAQLFFKMLASAAGNNSNEVDVETFVGGCMRLKGYATSIDVHTLIYELRIMYGVQKEFFRHVSDRFRHIDSNTNKLRKYLQKTSALSPELLIASRQGTQGTLSPESENNAAMPALFEDLAQRARLDVLLPKVPPGEMNMKFDAENEKNFGKSSPIECPGNQLGTYSFRQLNPEFDFDKGEQHIGTPLASVESSNASDHLNGPAPKSPKYIGPRPEKFVTYIDELVTPKESVHEESFEI